MAFTSKLAGLALLAPALMMATISGGGPVVVSGPANLFTYDITATGLDTSVNQPIEDINATWNLTFSTIDSERYNAAPGSLNSFQVSGMPADGWVYDNNRSGLTSYGNDGAAIVTFDDTNNDGYGIASVTYTFYGNDAFWAQTGGPFNFGATQDPSAPSGAFFVFNSETADGPCTACTVTSVATPEPGSVGLLAALIGLGLVPFRKKLQKRAE